MEPYPTVGILHHSTSYETYAPKQRTHHRAYRLNQQRDQGMYHKMVNLVEPVMPVYHIIVYKYSKERKESMNI